MIFYPNLTSTELAIYIHWPFCKAKCPYCDFNSHVRESIDYDRWARNYLREIGFFKETIQGKYIKSIFFGGGTPSLMPPKLVKLIIDKIAEYGLVTEQTEITIEANPTSSEAENFHGYKEAGVNRISIGVQALVDKDLKFLGRQHSAQEAKEVIQLARQNFSRYSFDLIYARPHQTISNWLLELEEAISLAASHISLYQLTIEKGTVFYKMYHEKKFNLPEDEQAASLFEATNKYLSAHGFRQYEISNYAKMGEESRHNLCYWRYEDYLGIGPGAHSRISYKNKEKCYMQAFFNFSSPENWLKAIEAEEHSIQQLNILTKKEIITEILIMGLRLQEGVSDKAFKKFFGTDITGSLNIKKLEFLKEKGLIEYSTDYIKVTFNGSKILNKVLLELI